MSDHDSKNTNSEDSGGNERSRRICEGGISSTDKHDEGHNKSGDQSGQFLLTRQVQGDEEGGQHHDDGQRLPPTKLTPEQSGLRNNGGTHKVTPSKFEEHNQ